MKTILTTTAVLALLSAPAIAADTKTATLKDAATKITEVGGSKGVVVVDELNEI